jgi:hypothetical protein
VEVPASTALWTKLVRSGEQIAALYYESNQYVQDEIDVLCIQLTKSARATGNQELLDAIETIEREVSAIMAENAKTFGEFLRDAAPERTDQHELIEDALKASESVRESMKTSRERLVVLRAALARLKNPSSS